MNLACSGNIKGYGISFPVLEVFAEIRDRTRLAAVLLIAPCSYGNDRMTKGCRLSCMLAMLSLLCPGQEHIEAYEK